MATDGAAAGDALATHPPTRIAWIYDGDHLRHPILRQALQTLVRAGHAMYVIDRAPWGAPISEGYRHERWPFHVPDSHVVNQMNWKQRLRVGLFRSFLRATLFRVRPRIILATLPTAAWQAWGVKRLLGARLVYYPFELFGDQSVTAAPRWVDRERQLLAHAVDAVITQNQMRARVYREERGARVEPTIVHNYKLSRSATPTGKLRRRLALSDSTRIVLYEGLLIKGRNLAELVRAVDFFPADVKLVLMGKHSSWFKTELLPYIERERADKVVPLEPVPLDEVVDWVADADVGVIIYDGQWRNNYYCEPGKLSDYVLAGVPIIAPDYPSIAPRILEAGIGTLFPSAAPEDLAKAILDVLSRPRQSWQPALREAARQMVWDTQTSRFLRAVLGPSEHSVHPRRPRKLADAGPSSSHALEHTGP